jgi:stage III sporulation protein SpoIIIAA
MLTEDRGPGVGKDGMVLLERLNDIVLDFGRTPCVWIGGTRYSFGDARRTVTEEDLDHVVCRVGEFGSDSRAGIDRKLHRVSCMRHRTDESIIGLTMRVGRSVTGNVAMLLDVLMLTRNSVLLLGAPCTGKTTIVREAARVLGEKGNVCVVDTSNEIAGDGRIPHRCIGQARRMMVPSLEKQWAVMVECVQNHSIDTMLVDEIGRSREVEAARTVKQRGVRLLASAHGDLRGLVANKELRGLIGGVENVTVGDEAAKEAARKRKRLGDGAGEKLSKIVAQRGGLPTFEVIVEVSSANLNEWRVILDAADAVDKILEGGKYACQVRTRDSDGDNVRIRDDLA